MMFARSAGLLASLLYTALAVGQTSPLPPKTTTIPVTTRIVYVDVIVRDGLQHIVHGLKQEDFKLEEDRKPQKVDFFAAHSYEMSSAEKPGISRPQVESSLEFSNVSARGTAPSAINIILFDLVNTPSLDQVNARRQLLKFLSSLPPGQQVALFLLSDRLHMIQNFTASSDRLVDAARHINPRDFSLIRSPSEVMQDNDFLTSLAQAMGRDPGGAIALMKAQEDQQAGSDADIRARITLAALAEIARATSGYSGRKNLLWLSESFPIAVGAQFQEIRFGALANLPGARETAELLASAQIAVYPISLLGLETEGVPASSSGVGEVSVIGSPMGSTLHPQMNDTLGSQFNDRSALRIGMNDLAEQTGGEAFVGTNDFAEALRRSMSDGSNYYTLAYQPDNQQWNGQFRKIRVALTRKGYSLTYRRGYFAVASSPSTDTVQQMNAALQPETPESTMLVLKSKVDLPVAGQPAIQVSSILDPAHLSLATTDNGHRQGQLLILLVAFNDGSGAVAQPQAPPQTSGVLNLDFDSKQYQEALSKGVTFTQQLKLAPGHYRLRLGVTDLQSHRLGTLDMPIQVPAVVQ